MSQSLKDEVRSDVGECEFCGISNDAHRGEYGEQLHVHRVLPNRAGGEYNRNNTVVVCTKCHDTLERTQSRALAKIKAEREDAPSQDRVTELTEQRDALLDRVELLERTITSQGFYEDAVIGQRHSVEIVTEMVGTDAAVTSDSEKAKEYYDEWGSALRREKVKITDVNLSSTIVDHSEIERRVKRAVGDELEGRMR